VAQEQHDDAIIIGDVGGDTAISVLARLGIQRLTVLRELLPGMPLTCGVDAAGVSHFVIMKAGSHGDETTLATLVARARSEMESEVSNDKR
jgi:uncharacterized protein YgbK (DUF1537 family)